MRPSLAFVLLPVLFYGAHVFAQQNSPTTQSAVAQAQPSAFYALTAQIVYFKKTADTDDPYTGVVKVTGLVRSNTDGALTLTPLFPPNLTSSATDGAILDFVAQATPGTSDVCSFQLSQASFTFKSKVPLKKVIVRSANNVLNVDSSDFVQLEKPSFDCGGLISKKIVGVEDLAKYGFPGIAARIVTETTTINASQVDPNRLNIFVDGSGTVTAMSWF